MRVFLGLILMVPLVFVWSGEGRAQFGFEIHGLYGFDFNGESDTLGDPRIKSGPGAGASFFAAFIPAVRVEAGVDYIRTKVQDLDDSDIRIAPLTAALRAGYNLGDLYLYLGGGVGYALGKLYPKWSVEAAFAERGMYDLGVSNDPIYFALAGAELAFSRRIGVRVEYRYNRLRTNLTYQDYRGFENKEKLNLDHQQIRAGLVVYF